ncbi:DegT/DnrJ/EryC1/StrS family aminotransferase [Williamwhitmania taraxaci]|uniref:GDP-perosamine synthase n=1 Tax=Williamwhitmania taraxaci TaxID=1640674 RepID=A0A1G6GLM1_9BACT|nr:DegT/DnrJ/EryC1/StrS family aminotransferase [Williamwhitmania taraxaci]SDB82901.1 perosamine synthetase [Williamwhitmania taraxaci]
MEFIPVCEPFLNGNELKYVDDCLKTGWISSSGKYVKAFEESFAAYCGARYAVGVTNGTVALHLALVAAGVGKGDEVIMPNFTMIATAFAACYAGAIPVFVDADPQTWNIDIRKIEEKITSRTKVIMPVSIFGHPCDMDEINALAQKYKLIVIEDAAESHGAIYRGRKVGTLANITSFSFFANKNLTTGEGGMIVTDSEELYKKALYFKNMCFPLDAPRNYLHHDIGFNYRISNIHAAIGLAQVERADEYKEMRITNHMLYTEFLYGVQGITFQQSRDYVTNVFWMNSIIIDPVKYGKTRDQLIAHLNECGVDTRLLFKGMNIQPSLVSYGCDCSGDYPVTDWLSENGFYLPSGSALTRDNIESICKIIIDYKGN